MINFFSGKFGAEGYRKLGATNRDFFSIDYDGGNNQGFAARHLGATVIGLTMDEQAENACEEFQRYLNSDLLKNWQTSSWGGNRLAHSRARGALGDPALG